jgi:hypothetical protein
MSLSMVLGIPATTTLRPRLLISCKIEELIFMERKEEGINYSFYQAILNMVDDSPLPNFPYLDTIAYFVLLKFVFYNSAHAFHSSLFSFISLQIMINKIRKRNKAVDYRALLCINVQMQLKPSSQFVKKHVTSKITDAPF